MTAEIIANVYYRALHGATRSDFLKAICTQVLRDERMHVQFQAERLAIIRKHRKQLMLVATNFFQRFLFAGTVLVVWMKCKDTLRAANYTFSSFVRDCWQELNLAIGLIDFRAFENASLSTTPSKALRAERTTKNA
jgi:hypothetical protein